MQQKTDATPARPKVEVDTSHRYGDLVVHEKIRFDVHPNEFVCICGPSGCGKTTLLDTLAGILKPTSGHVLIDGETANPKRQSISFVFQEPSTFPWLTVRQNVATGLAIRGTQRAEIDRRVDEILEVVGLKGAEAFYPYQISGGMKQRVAIARAFATDADLILMDEPFVSLDQPTRERMQQEVLDIWRRRRRTVIFVTHNLEEAVFLADRIIVLSAKPGRVVADLPVRLPRPRDQLSPDFMELRARCMAHLHPRAAGAPVTSS
ncbi:MAG: ABC transporter ATP-binding protein [Hyphomicrobiales bacterium]|nr:MAG: ABC transporter ATP-binding protein [Hyphomicrobiales bacterium]